MTTIKTIMTIACVTLASLALVGCGGDDTNGDGGNGSPDGRQSSSASGGSGDIAQDGPAYRVTDEFVTHMANREFAEARMLVKNGGGAPLLDEYIQTAEQAATTPNAAPIYEPVLSKITQRFADASIEVVERGEDTATVRLTLGDESYDMEVSAIDGATWTIALPGDMLVPAVNLIGETAGEFRRTRQGDDDDSDG